MEKIVSTITMLCDKYRNNPKTLEKLNYYITKELPELISNNKLGIGFQCCVHASQSIIGLRLSSFISLLMPL